VPPRTAGLIIFSTNPTADAGGLNNSALRAGLGALEGLPAQPPIKRATDIRPSALVPPGNCHSQAARVVHACVIIGVSGYGQWNDKEAR
jgi:hypothetical protein